MSFAISLLPNGSFWEVEIPIGIVCISDMHKLQREVDVPDGDLLIIHAGDFTTFSRNAYAIRNFNQPLEVSERQGI